MKDILEKGFILGLGAASLTRKKAEKVINSVIKRGKMSRREGRDLLVKMLQEGNKERKRLQAFISKEVDAQVKKTKPRIKKGAKTLEKEGKRVVRKVLKRL